MTLYQPMLSAEQLNARSVRQRLFSSKAMEILSPEEKKIRAMDIQLKSMRFELDKKDAEVQRLRADLADAQARILSQARQICEMIDGDSIEEGGEPRKSVKDIVAAVLEDYPGVTVDDVIGIRRHRDLVEPRSRCHYEVYRQRPDLSLPSIGKIMKRDHTTILHSVGKFRTGNER